MPLTADPLVDTLREEMSGLSNPQKRSARPGPLHQVKCGSVCIPIYRCASGPLTRYFICYYQGGRRIRRGFSHLDDAKREAQLAGRQIAAGLEKATGQIVTVDSGLHEAFLARLSQPNPKIRDFHPSAARQPA